MKIAPSASRARTQERRAPERQGRQQDHRRQPRPAARSGCRRWAPRCRCCANASSRLRSFSLASDTERRKSVRSRPREIVALHVLDLEIGHNADAIPQARELLAEVGVLDVGVGVVQVEAARVEKGLAAGSPPRWYRRAARPPLPAARRCSASRGSCSGCTRCRNRMAGACTAITPSSDGSAAKASARRASVSGRTITSESTKNTHVAGRRRRAAVARARGTEPAAARDRRGTVRRGDLARAVGRAVVDDHDLVVGAARWHGAPPDTPRAGARRCRPASRPRCAAPSAVRPVDARRPSSSSAPLLIGFPRGAAATVGASASSSARMVVPRRSSIAGHPRRPRATPGRRSSPGSRARSNRSCSPREVVISL